MKVEDVVVANVSQLTSVGRRLSSLSVFAATSAVLLSVGTGAALAQSPSADADQVRSRQRISMMEGALERAVSNGAENMLRKVRSVMPDPPMLTGAPRVRGFRLDGYGVFFDVEVPALRMPLTWTMRYMLDDRRATLNELLSELRRLPAGSPNRERVDLLVRQLERADGPKESSAVASDPNEAYTEAVKESLLDAMLENSGPIALSSEEWLTVAARDNLPRDPLIPGDTAELNTVIFRLKGSDLAAFRAGRLTLEDARKRVEAREY
jgi:hypothetical protein